MLDHIFTDAIGALRDGLEDVRLERLADEEHFRSDMLLGDLTWKTSYGLPGEGLQPKMSSDVTLSWSSWSQAAYRSWFVSGDYVEPPNIGIRIALCLSNLTEQSARTKVMTVLPQCSPKIGDATLSRGSLSNKIVYDQDFSPVHNLFQIPYEGIYYLDEFVLADGSKLDEHFNTLGSWLASTLVRIGNLELSSV